MEEFSISGPDYKIYKLIAEDLDQALDMTIERFPNHTVIPGPEKIFVRKENPGLY
ncbi:hypothetical protein [Desulfolucanica intricata]|uniref:hypothetical protein n=1 Tax=Desulfolucanica intricata TaxID=1285191 RepID=UPI000A917F50|nr:hypothetical protein [Desulfolucanica intricata]